MERRIKVVIPSEDHPPDRTEKTEDIQVGYQYMKPRMTWREKIREIFRILRK